MKTFKDLKSGDKVIIIDPNSLKIQFLPIQVISRDIENQLIFQIEGLEALPCIVDFDDDHCVFNPIDDPERKREIGEIWINPREAYSSLSCNLKGKIKIVNKGLRSLELLGTAILGEE